MNQPVRQHLRSVEAEAGSTHSCAGGPEVHLSFLGMQGSGMKMGKRVQAEGIPSACRTTTTSDGNQG